MVKLALLISKMAGLLKLATLIRIWVVGRTPATVHAKLPLFGVELARTNDHEAPPLTDRWMATLPVTATEVQVMVCLLFLNQTSPPLGEITVMEGPG